MGPYASIGLLVAKRVVRAGLLVGGLGGRWRLPGLRRRSSPVRRRALPGQVALSAAIQPHTSGTQKYNATIATSPNKTAFLGLAAASRRSFLPSFPRFTALTAESGACHAPFPAPPFIG